MRMKKWMAWMLSAILTLAAVLPLSALAEEAVPDTELEGFVTELVEGGFIMEDKDCLLYTSWTAYPWMTLWPRPFSMTWENATRRTKFLKRRAW